LAAEKGNRDIVNVIWETAKEEGIDLKTLFAAKNYYIIQAALHSGNFDQISQVLEMAKEIGVEQEMFKARGDSVIQYLLVKKDCYTVILFTGRKKSHTLKKVFIQHVKY
jgi:hypothetical protein